MVPSRWKILVSPGKFLVRKERPWPRIAGALLLSLLLVWGGIFLWGQYHLQAAQSACDQHLYGDARKHINRCLAVWPSSYRANLLAARICRILVDYPEAEKHLAACLKRQAKSEDLALEWVLLRAQKGEFLSFEYQMRKWLDDGHSQATLILESLAFCYIKDGRLGAAHRTLEKWLLAEPNSLAYFWRGLAFEKVGAPNEAREDFVRALELCPDRWEARSRLVQLLFAEKEIDEAQTHLRILEQSQPQNPEVWFLNGLNQFQMGQLDAAEKTFDRVLEVLPNHAQALHDRGKLALQTEDYSQAAEFFRLALKADPELISPHYSCYQALQQLPGREREAQMEFTAYKEKRRWAERQRKLLEDLDKAPKNVDLLIEAGELFLQKKQLARGQQYLMRAIQLQPGNKKAVKLLRDSTPSSAGSRN
jgi:tetratricopeptide (TPR) repeat protein